MKNDSWCNLSCDAGSREEHALGRKNYIQRIGELIDSVLSNDESSLAKASVGWG
jgi:hypothetical protein